MLVIRRRRPGARAPDSHYGPDTTVRRDSVQVSPMPLIDAGSRGRPRARLALFTQARRAAMGAAYRWESPNSLATFLSIDAAPTSTGYRANISQKLLASMTSPLAFVATAHQVCWLTLSLMNLTEPSRNVTFTPPGWFELAPMMVEVGCPAVLLPVK